MYDELDRAEKFERDWEAKYKKQLNTVLENKHRGKMIISMNTIIGSLRVRILLKISHRGEICTEVFVFKSGGRSLAERALHIGPAEEEALPVSSLRVSANGGAVKACKKFLREFLDRIKRDPDGEQYKILLLSRSSDNV